MILEEKWKIDYIKWVMNFVYNAFYYLLIPMVIMNFASSLNSSIDVNTFFWVFICLLIIKWIWTLQHPPRYQRVIEEKEVRERHDVR